MNTEPADNKKASGDGVRAQGHVDGRPAAIEQDVVEMAAVAGEGRHALAQTPDDGQKEVHQRQRCENQRQEPVRTDAMVNSIEIEAEKSDQEAQHGASGIAHENAGGRKVIGQKSEASAQQAPSDG